MMSDGCDTDGNRWGQFAGSGTLTRLDALTATGANTVPFVGRSVQDGPSVTSITPSARTTDLDVLGTLIDRARADGLNVALTTHPDPTNGTDRALIAPTDIAGWFTSDKTMLLGDAQLAQAPGVHKLSLGTEPDGVVATATLPCRNDPIDAVRQVYAGTLTDQSDFHAAGAVRFSNKFDPISVDGYGPVATGGPTTAARNHAADRFLSNAPVRPPGNVFASGEAGVA